MKTWFVYPKNEAATQALAQFNEDRAYSRRECIDWKGRHETLKVTAALEAEIERLEKDKKSYGLEFTTYLQETEGGKIRECTLQRHQRQQLHRGARRAAMRVSQPSISQAVFGAHARATMKASGLRSGLPVV